MVEAGVGIGQIISVTGHANPSSVVVHEKYAYECKLCIDGRYMVKHYKCRKGKCITCIIYITLSELDIPNGSTKRMNCPNCGGYKTSTNNMGSLMWNYYKASWRKGGERVRLSVDDIRTGSRCGRVCNRHLKYKVCRTTS